MSSNGVEELSDDMREIASALSDNDLIEFAHNMKVHLNETRDKLGYLEMLILQRMNDYEASKINTGQVTVELEITKSYDQKKLAQLLDDELVSSRLIENGAYVPEHEVTTKVAGKFNMTKLKPLAKEGKKYRQIIEDSENVHERKTRLKIKHN